MQVIDLIIPSWDLNDVIGVFKYVLKIVIKFPFQNFSVTLTSLNQLDRICYINLPIAINIKDNLCFSPCVVILLYYSEM